jgi:hypothetical protein
VQTAIVSLPDAGAVGSFRDVIEAFR